MRRVLLTLIVPALLAAGCASSTSSSGSTGRLATPGATGAHRAHYTNWPNYNRGPAKSGVAAAGVRRPLHQAWRARLNGSVWSQPVIADGILIAATEHNGVYGLNPTTGKRIWRVNLGTPEPLSQQPCGDIDPIGITGSPAYDPATGSVFVVATTGRGRHTLWALNARTGHRRWHRSVDVDKARDKNAEQQRASLLVIDRRVIVTFGAHAGDCGNYVGYATSTPTSGKGKIRYYAVPNARQSGMWSPPGPVEAYDGNILRTDRERFQPHRRPLGPQRRAARAQPADHALRPRLGTQELGAGRRRRPQPQLDLAGARRRSLCDRRQARDRLAAQPRPRRRRRRGRCGQPRLRCVRRQCGAGQCRDPAVQVRRASAFSRSPSASARCTSSGAPATSTAPLSSPARRSTSPIRDRLAQGSVAGHRPWSSRRSRSVHCRPSRRRSSTATGSLCRR